MPKVVKTTLEIYQQILSLRFEEVEGATVWHSDVRCFSVFDKTSNEFMGHFYLDLFPRNGKYSHAACFPVQIAYGTGENRQCAKSAMVANLSKPTSQKPSLLKFSEVKTFFHEFGHVMHSICSKSKYSRLNWTWSAVEQDFLETPSMMLENWVYEPEILNKISSHYEDGSPLPHFFITQLIKAKNSGAALSWKRLIFMALFDMAIHSPNGYHNLEETWVKNRKIHFPIEFSADTKPYASWMHLTTGYDAGYYGYLWSQVFSKDLFTAFKANGILSSIVGMRFRKTILEPCAIQEGGEMLRAFLGREPNDTAFLEDLEI